MSEKKPPRAVGAPLWGILLLSVGVVFLLQTLNVLPWGLWGTLWRFWPVVIITIGLGILLRRYNIWLVSLLILAILGACLGIAIWQYGPSPAAGQITKSYSQPLGSVQQAQIEIDFTAGSLTINSLPAGSLNLVEVDSTLSNGETGIRVDFHRQDGQGSLHLSRERVDWPFWGKDENRWLVNLNRNIPLTVAVRFTASNANLELSQLQIVELRMDVDLGNYTVKMPSSAGTIHVYIKANLANLEVIIPDGVAVRLRADVDLGHLGVDESRFPRKGDYYVSPDFESAPKRIELELDCNLGRVQVK